MVFDHTGKLAYHHMCGDYHGGDGLAMIEWVDKLLAQAPAIYLGDDPFPLEEKLAEQVSKKKNLKAALADIQKGKAAPETDEARMAELTRLEAAIVDYRDRMTAAATAMMATKPSGTLPAMKDLLKEFKGTTLAEAVEARVSELSKSKELKDAIAIEKKLAKILRGLEKRKPCKSCDRKGLESLNAECNTCRRESKSAIAKAVAKLDALIEGKESLPIAATVKQHADMWR
jgi:hypothetical protein